MVQFFCLRDQAIIYLSSKNLGGKGAAHEENLSDILFIWLEMKKTIRGRKHYWKPDSHGLITISSNKLKNPGGREAVNKNKPVRYSLCGLSELHLLAKHQSDTILEKVYDNLLANTFFKIIFWQTIRHLLYDNLWTNHESLFGRKFM